MSFKKTTEEIENIFRLNTGDFYDAEVISVYWETKPEIVEKLLPPPLKPAKHPVATAFVADYPRTNFGVSYKEAALFLYAEYGGIQGMYCLSMPVDNDIALILGRETFGYPKKMANIHIKRNENEVEGWIERHGKRFFEVSANLTNKTNAKDAMNILLELGLNPTKPLAITYNFKYFSAPDFWEFDFNPRLIREEVTMQPSTMSIGEVDIKLKFSEDDPWSEVEVERILGGVYLITNNQMQPGEVVAETDPEEFRPFAYAKLDRFVKEVPLIKPL